MHVNFLVDKLRMPKMVKMPKNGSMTRNLNEKCPDINENCYNFLIQKK